MIRNMYLMKVLAWCPKESLKQSIISRTAIQKSMLKRPVLRRDVRKELLEYIKIKEDAYIFQMPEDLSIHLVTLARELKILIDKGCVKGYNGVLYSLTPEGVRELRMLKGEYNIHKEKGSRKVAAKKGRS